MQGAYVTVVDPESGLEVQRRPKSKKELREAAAENPANAHLERTAFADFGSDAAVGEYSCSLADMPAGTYSVVGPDPYTKRSWYATIVVKLLPGNQRTVIVK